MIRSDRRGLLRNEKTDEVRESGRPGPLGWAQSLTTLRTRSHWSRDKIPGPDWLMRAGAGAWPCQPELSSDHLPEPEPPWLVTRPSVRDGGDVSIGASILRNVQCFPEILRIYAFTHTQLMRMTFIRMSQTWAAAGAGPSLVTQATVHTEQVEGANFRNGLGHRRWIWSKTLFPRVQPRCGAWCGRGEWMEKTGSMDH